MDESRHHLKGLIVGVLQLCTRTRSMAEAGERDPLALHPLRESIDVLLRTLDELELAWEHDTTPPALPAAAPESASWLLDEA